MIPDPFSEVFPNLYVGRTPTKAAELPKGTKVLVCCARELQPPKDRFPDVRVVRCPLDDEEGLLDAIERTTVKRAVYEVKYAMHYHKRVLVCCAAGVNRSALIAALAIRQYTGFGANVVLTMLRQKRYWRCLSNRSFEDMVRATGTIKIPKTA